MFLHKIIEFGRFFLSALIDLIFPPVCCSCHKIGHYLCPVCFGLVEFCLIPLPNHLNPNYIDELWAVTRYQFPINELIKLCKYRHVKDAGTFIGRLIYDAFNVPLTETITAVPLHPARQKTRGFNQAEVIAKELATQMDLPYQQLLIRAINTKHQASLGSKESRLTNLNNAFQLHPDFIVQKLPSTVLIIDDVVTTGTTVNECAQILKKHGVKKVIALAVAHGQ